MELELKELLHNPKFLYSVAAVLSIFLIVTCIDLYRAIKHNDSMVDFSNIEINLSEEPASPYPKFKFTDLPNKHNITLNNG